MDRVGSELAINFRAFSGTDSRFVSVVMAMAAADAGWKQALRDNHQGLRCGLIVNNILPNFRPRLADIEYIQVKDRSGNVAQVDELVQILLTKERRHFDWFCGVCERKEYQNWAEHLRSSADGRKKAQGRRQEAELMPNASVMNFVD